MHVQSFHLGKEGVLILMMHIIRLHVDLDQLEDEETPYYMPVATSRSTFFFSFMFLNP